MPIFWRFQSHWISPLRFWHFSVLSFSLSVILFSPGIATSIIIAAFSSLLTLALSGLLFAIILSHCIFMSHISLRLTFSQTVWGLCRYYFSDLTIFQDWIFHTISNEPFQQHCHVFTHNMTNCFACLYEKMNQHFYQCGIWRSLSLLLVLVQNISGSHLVFLITFSQPELGSFSFSVPSGISLINCPCICLSF